MFMDTTGVSQDNVIVPIPVDTGAGAPVLAELGVRTGDARALHHDDRDLREPESRWPVSSVPFPGPYPVGFPAFFDMPFDVTLPNPVPPTGVQFDAIVPDRRAGGLHRARWPHLLRRQRGRSRRHGIRRQLRALLLDLPQQQRAHRARDHSTIGRRPSNRSSPRARPRSPRRLPSGPAASAPTSCSARARPSVTSC